MTRDYRIGYSMKHYSYFLMHKQITFFLRLFYALLQ